MVQITLSYDYLLISLWEHLLKGELRYDSKCGYEILHPANGYFFLF